MAGRRVLAVFIASVWLVNGLYCKLLNGVPRHEQIVAKILGDAHARPLTLAIGVAEILMAVWILTGYRSRFNCAVQIVVVVVMNVVEFLVAPELLLWGRWNLPYALLFAGLVYLFGYIGKDAPVRDVA